MTEFCVKRVQEVIRAWLNSQISSENAVKKLTSLGLTPREAQRRLAVYELLRQRKSTSGD